MVVLGIKPAGKIHSIMYIIFPTFSAAYQIYVKSVRKLKKSLKQISNSQFQGTVKSRVLKPSQNKEGLTFVGMLVFGIDFFFAARENLKLCTVIFGPKSSKLNSRPGNCLQIYSNIYVPWSIFHEIFPYLT